VIRLPFFENRHRELHSRLAGIRGRFDPVIARGDSDVDAAGLSSLRECADLGLCRLLVPPEFGGDGLDLRSLCLAREALAAASGLADAVFAVHGLGSYPLMLAAPAAIAQRYLPDAARGRAVGAFAITEPAAGSDLASMSTRAVRDGDTYVLDGAKVFISNSTIASFFIVFARTAEGSKRAVSAFVIDAGHPGMTIGRRQEVIAPHPLAEVRFEACRVPSAQRLGEEGDGMRIALGTLDFFRPSVGAAACGFAARALDESREHVKSRTQFGSPLSEFQLTQAALAEMATELDAARLLVYRAAWTKDSGRERLAGESAMAKLFATEAAQRIVDRAVQLHGGRGVERGSVVERLYREVRALRIYEGTSEIQRLLIAREVLDPSR
jgi:acyl-CoA dehydrogenase